jgi:SAM-dependent methyltransferase
VGDPDPSIPQPGARADHVRLNRAAWDRYAEEYVEPGRRNWASESPDWGIFGVLESDLRVLPAEVEGKDVVELGCGTGYVSAWLARRGARPVGVDLSARQLETASRFQSEFGLRFPLIQGDAEAVPLRDASFDLAISEYGAAIWCDPYRWIPEAARLLRPGGELIFLGNGTILLLCEPDLESEGPAGDRLLRDYFGMYRFEWPDEPTVEFHLGYGDWIRLLRAHGFEILDLVEVRPREGATSRYPFVTAEWARRWPCEEIWKARKVR